MASKKSAANKGKSSRDQRRSASAAAAASSAPGSTPATTNSPDPGPSARTSSSVHAGRTEFLLNDNTYTSPVRKPCEGLPRPLPLPSSGPSGAPETASQSVSPKTLQTNTYARENNADVLENISGELLGVSVSIL